MRHALFLIANFAETYLGGSRGSPVWEYEHMRANMKAAEKR